MENNSKLIETLLERAAEYANSSIELAKLKLLDKAADIISTLIPRSVVLLVILTLVFFLNFGLGYWIGNLLDNISYGFFIIAGFYFLLAIVLHFFIHKRFKEMVSDYIIRQFLK